MNIHGKEQIQAKSAKSQNMRQELSAERAGHLVIDSFFKFVLKKNSIWATLSTQPFPSLTHIPHLQEEQKSEDTSLFLAA